MLLYKRAALTYLSYLRHYHKIFFLQLSYLRVYVTADVVWFIEDQLTLIAVFMDFKSWVFIDTVPVSLLEHITPVTCWTIWRFFIRKQVIRVKGLPLFSRTMKLKKKGFWSTWTICSLLARYVIVFVHFCVTLNILNHLIKPYSLTIHACLFWRGALVLG